MPKAYALINCKYGYEEEIIYQTVKGTSWGYRNLHALDSYDLIASVSLDIIDNLKKLITWSIRRIDKTKMILPLIQ